MSQLNIKNTRKLVKATLYILMMILLLATTTYAWFTLTNENNSVFVSQISGVEAEYEFYVYNDPTLSENTNLTLINNTTTSETEYDKYLKIDNPTTNYIVPEYMAPGDMSQFALKIINVGTTSGQISLSFANIISEGYDLDVNKIQTAFKYSVDKISYINDGVETSDQKDLLSLYYYEDYFSKDDNLDYDLINDVPLGIDDNAIVVIYFKLYFDPTIYGKKSDGTSYTNSNIFMGQKLYVNKIYMDLSA